MMTKEEVIRKRPSGFSAERELVIKLWRLGFAVIRGPASGSRIKRGVYPDIVAIKNRHVFVLEVKKRSKLSHIYIDKSQLEKIKEFARRAGGEALIVIKIPSLGGWRVIPVDYIKEVSANRARIDKELIEQAEDMLSYINKKINIGLDNYVSKESKS